MRGSSTFITLPDTGAASNMALCIIIDGRPVAWNDQAAGLMGIKPGGTLADIIKAPAPLPEPPWEGSLETRLADWSELPHHAVHAKLTATSSALLIFTGPPLPTAVMETLRTHDPLMALRAGATYRIVSRSYASLFDSRPVDMIGKPTGSIMSREQAENTRRVDAMALLHRTPLSHGLPSGRGSTGQSIREITIPLHQTPWGSATLSIATPGIPDWPAQPAGAQEAHFTMPPATADRLPDIAALAEVDGTLRLLNRMGHEVLRLPYDAATKQTQPSCMPGHGSMTACGVSAASLTASLHSGASTAEASLPHLTGQEQHAKALHTSASTPRQLSDIAALASRLTSFKHTEYELRGLLLTGGYPGQGAHGAHVGELASATSGYHFRMHDGDEPAAQEGGRGAALSSGSAPDDPGPDDPVPGGPAPDGPAPDGFDPAAPPAYPPASSGPAPHGPALDGPDSDASAPGGIPERMMATACTLQTVNSKEHDLEHMTRNGATPFPRHDGANSTRTIQQGASAADRRRPCLRSELEAVVTAFKQSREQFDTLLDQSATPVLLLSGGTRINACNSAVELITGHSRAALIGQNPASLFASGLFPLTSHHVNSAMSLQSRIRRANGTDYPAEVTILPFEDGTSTLLLALTDVTGRATSEQRLPHFEEAFRNSMEGMIITDATGFIIATNPAFTTITGWSEQDVLGQNPRILKSGSHDKAFYEKLWHSLLTRGAWEGEIWNRRRSGELYPQWLTISTVRDPSGSIRNFIGMFHDISELKNKETQIRYQGMHDTLTGLPNRALFLERLEEAVAATAGTGRLTAIIFIDLDNFKAINDNFGHAEGDRYLREVSLHLSTLIRPEDTLARLGGDEFVILVQNPTDENAVILVAERILRHFSSPLNLLGRDLHVGMSLGIAIHPFDASTTNELLSHADLAMYKAKKQGKGHFERFSPTMHDREHSRTELESKLRDALQHGDIIPHFQPRIDIRTGRIVGIEALARWPNGQGADVRPDIFIPVAEDIGLICNLGEQILHSALLFARKLLDKGHPPLKVSVNLSMLQCAQSDLVLKILSSLRDTGISPRMLELEIAESAIMSDVQRTIRRFARLAAMGVSLSVDDFGTGYTSIYHLKHLPLSTLKIDQSFVRDLPNTSGDDSIVLAMLSMAQNLGLSVVAEGVEKPEQLRFLQEHGCSMVQGYLFCPPLPEDKLMELLDLNAVFDVDELPGSLIMPE